MKSFIAIVQKWIGTVSLVIFGFLAVYAISMATPTAVCASYGGPETWVTTFYQPYQTANDILLGLAVAGILFSLFFKLFRSPIRKIFYISNFLTSGILGVWGLTAGIYSFVATLNYQIGYMSLPFEAMNEYWLSHGSTTQINTSPFVFPFGYIMSALVILLGLVALTLFAVKLLERIAYEKGRNEENAALEENDYE